jgi:hypothetical protein
MSQIRLYLDEDAAQHAIVDGLRNRGVDVLTVLEAGMTSTTDEEQLKFATSQGRSIYVAGASSRRAAAGCPSHIISWMILPIVRNWTNPSSSSGTAELPRPVHSREPWRTAGAFRV